MSRRDRRPGIVQGAFEHPDLGNAERLFLLTVVHLPTEYVDGERRPGSQGMTAGGNFALHYDYLARALHTSPGNVRKLAQRLEAKGVLSKRWPGTFGRPAGYEALDVRGDNTYRITFRAFVPPYGDADPTVRRDTTSPLTYRTPDDGEHKTAARVSRPAPLEAEAAIEGRWSEGSASRLTACEAHGWTACPDRECIDAEARRTAS